LKRKKRLKLEVVVDEALKLLPRGMDIPCFTEWVKEAIEQDKKLPRPRIYRNHYEESSSTTDGFQTLQANTSSDAIQNR